MITKDQFDTEIQLIITNAIREDVGDGDHSSLAWKVFWPELSLQNMFSLM